MNNAEGEFSKDSQRSYLVIHESSMYRETGKMQQPKSTRNVPRPSRVRPVPTPRPRLHQDSNQVYGTLAAAFHSPSLQNNKIHKYSYKYKYKYKYNYKYIHQQDSKFSSLPRTGHCLKKKTNKIKVQKLIQIQRQLQNINKIQIQIFIMIQINFTVHRHKSIRFHVVD